MSLNSNNNFPCLDILLKLQCSYMHHAWKTAEKWDGLFDRNPTNREDILFGMALYEQVIIIKWW